VEFVFESYATSCEDRTLEDEIIGCRNHEEKIIYIFHNLASIERHQGNGSYLCVQTQLFVRKTIDFPPSDKFKPIQNHMIFEESSGG
jgi:hypothetical protein